MYAKFIHNGTHIYDSAKHTHVSHMHTQTHTCITHAHTRTRTHACTHAHTHAHTHTHTVHTCTQTVHTYLLFFLLEREDGWLAKVSVSGYNYKFADPPPTTGKVQAVLSSVVGEVSQASILPALLTMLVL